MRRYVVVLVLLVVAGFTVAQETTDLEQTLTGTWQLYRTDTIGDYSLNEHSTSPPTSSFMEATLVLNADGTMSSDSQTLRFTSWGVSTGYLYFETPSGNSFYKVRDLSENVLYLVSVVITERNRNVTQIEVNSNANLVLVREQ